MGLPIQKAPTYKCVLPVSDIEVEYRPFLVKEQNHLLVARESEDQSQIFDAIMKLIHAVTEGKVKGDKLPLVDLEYLFLKIRTKSVGESAQVPLVCLHKPCDGIEYVEMNLDDIEVDISSMKDNKVELNDNLVIELKPAPSKLVYELEGKDDAEMIKPILRNCMVRIYDDENIYEMTDYRNSEIDEFVESLTVSQFEKISEYFESMPALRKEVEYKCSKCGKKSLNILSGLQSFF